MTQHTPGPWHFNGENIDAERCAHKDGICKMLYVGDHDPDLNEQVDADASLIAAAPDLLEALRFILAFYEPGQTYLDTNAWAQAEASGRAAIAKATGQ